VKRQTQAQFFLKKNIVHRTQNIAI